MQQRPHQLNMPATRFLRGHGLADQLQLFSLPGTEIPSTAGATEQVQQEVAPAAQFSLAAIGKVENHRVPNYSAF